MMGGKDARDHRHLFHFSERESECENRARRRGGLGFVGRGHLEALRRLGMDMVEWLAGPDEGAFRADIALFQLPLCP
jgi:hypothetical protein